MKEVHKQINIVDQKADFYVWIYEFDDVPGEKFAGGICKSKEDALKMVPPYKKKILVSFSVAEDDFEL